MTTSFAAASPTPSTPGTALATSADQDPAPEALWLVLVNAQGQHALWPLERPVPAGWQETGPEGSRDDCLAWIDAHWTDMRPLSLQG